MNPKPSFCLAGIRGAKHKHAPGLGREGCHVPLLLRPRNQGYPSQNHTVANEGFVWLIPGYEITITCFDAQLACGEGDTGPQPTVTSAPADSADPYSWRAWGGTRSTRSTSSHGRSARSSPRPLARYTLQPTPYTLHPTPFNLHLTPYTLHPAPCTLQFTPYTSTRTACPVTSQPHFRHIPES